MLILVSCGALFNVRKGYRAAERGTVKGLDMSAIRAKHKQQKGHSEVNGLMDILQRCPGFAAMFTVGTTKRKKTQKTFASVKLMPSAGSRPTLIFLPAVAKSVGTAFRTFSRGGRLTPTYRPALAYLHAECGHLPNAQSV